MRRCAGPDNKLSLRSFCNCFAQEDMVLKKIRMGRSLIEPQLLRHAIMPGACLHCYCLNEQCQFLCKHFILEVIIAVGQPCPQCVDDPAEVIMW